MTTDPKEPKKPIDPRNIKDTRDRAVRKRVGATGDKNWMRQRMNDAQKLWLSANGNLMPIHFMANWSLTPGAQGVPMPDGTVIAAACERYNEAMGAFVATTPPPMYQTLDQEIRRLASALPPSLKQDFPGQLSDEQALIMADLISGPYRGIVMNHFQSNLDFASLHGKKPGGRA